MAAVLNNWGPAADAVLSPPAPAHPVSELILGQTISLRRTPNASEARIDMSAGGSAVLMVVTG